MRAHGAPPLAVVVSQGAEPDSPDFEQTVTTVARFLPGVPVLAARRDGDRAWVAGVLDMVLAARRVQGSQMPVGRDYRPDPRVVELGAGVRRSRPRGRFPADDPALSQRPGRGDRGARRPDRHRVDRLLRPLRAPAGHLDPPLALRYHGHQFRVYNPDLGDGRGFTFAQMREAGSDRLLDLGTKGSGKTPGRGPPTAG